MEFLRSSLRRQISQVRLWSIVTYKADVQKSYKKTAKDKTKIRKEKKKKWIPLSDVFEQLLAGKFIG